MTHEQRASAGYGRLCVFPQCRRLLPVGRYVGCYCCNARLEECSSEGKPLPGVLYGDTDWVDNDGNYMSRRRLTPPEKLTWRSFRHGMLVCHQAFYARTDLAQKVPYDLRYRFSADVDWCIRIMKEAEKESLPLVNVHATIADYQREGQSTKNHRASLLERFDVMSVITDLPLSSCMPGLSYVR